MVFISACCRASGVKIMVIITIVAEIAELQQCEWEFSWQKNEQSNPAAEKAQDNKENI